MGGGVHPDYPLWYRRITRRYLGRSGALFGKMMKDFENISLARSSSRMVRIAQRAMRYQDQHGAPRLFPHAQRGHPPADSDEDEPEHASTDRAEWEQSVPRRHAHPPRRLHPGRHSTSSIPEEVIASQPEFSVAPPPAMEPFHMTYAGGFYQGTTPGPSYSEFPSSSGYPGDIVGSSQMVHSPYYTPDPSYDMGPIQTPPAPLRLREHDDPMGEGVTQLTQAHQPYQHSPVTARDFIHSPEEAEQGEEEEQHTQEEEPRPKPSVLARFGKAVFKRREKKRKK